MPLSVKSDPGKENELRRSQRPSRPSQKVKENAETEFWESLENIKQAQANITKKRHRTLSPSMQMNLQRDIKSLQEDLRIIYDKYRSVSVDEVPQAIRQAIDQEHENLKGLKERVSTMVMEETDRKSVSSSSSSRRAQLEARRLEIEQKKLEDQRMRVVAELEMEEKRKRIEIEFEQQRRAIETQRLEGELRQELEDLELIEGASTISEGNPYKREPIEHQTRYVPATQDPERDMPQARTSGYQHEPVLPTGNISHADRELHVMTTEEVARNLAESISLSRLPIPEPFKFDGDPLSYTAWRSSFSTLIETKGIQAKEKIYYLRKYLSDGPREAVESLFLFNTEEAYTQAMEILEERYGNQFFIAEGFRTKTEEWQRIAPSDNKGLLKFTDFLQQCLFATSHIPSLSILNDCRENKRMLSKLPDWITRKWRSIITDHTERGQYPTFKAFVSFLSKESRIVNNPICLPAQTSRPRNPQRTVNTNTLQAKPDDQKSCTYCEKSHHLINDCRSFAQLSPKDRSEFVMKKGLCFGCLVGGHRSKECPGKSTCSQCSKKHPTVMCGDYEKLYPKENSSTEGKDKIAHSLCVNQGSTSGMIVPVYVSHVDDSSKEVLVYALLDTQSDATFISEDALKKLGALSTETNLTLSTITNTSTIRSNRVNNLLVRGIDSHKQITIPTAFTRELIPANVSHIPTKKATSRWPHLQSVVQNIPDRQDCEVGLLIGYDCPQALAPLEAKGGSGNEPFAVKTELGWSVVGSTHRQEEEDNITHRTVAHRTITKEIPNDATTDRDERFLMRHRTKIKEQLAPSETIKILGRDFQENPEEKMMSQEDLQLKDKSIPTDPKDFERMPLSLKKTLQPILTNGRITIKKGSKSIISDNQFMTKKGPPPKTQPYFPNNQFTTKKPPPEFSANDPEVKKSIAHTLKAQQATTLVERLQRFSNWDGAIRAVATILRAVYKKTGKDTSNLHREAETKIVQLVQEQEFSEEMSILRQGKTLPKNKRLVDLSPFIDENGILCVGGRIERSSYLFHEKQPMILPGSSHITNLIIKKGHEKMKHQGRGMTMNELRSKGYWIVGASKAVSSVIFKCVTCRRLREKNMKQRMA